MALQDLQKELDLIKLALKNTDPKGGGAGNPERLVTSWGGMAPGLQPGGRPQPGGDNDRCRGGHLPG